MDSTKIIATSIALCHLFENEKINTSNVASMITDIIDKTADVKNPNQQDIIYKILCEIAKGKDGLMGTSDDAISEETMTQLKHMISTSLLQDVISCVYDAVYEKKFMKDKYFMCISKCF